MMYQVSISLHEPLLEFVQELNPAGKGALSDQERVVLRVVNAITRSVGVGQGLFDELKAFSEKEVVETVSTVSCYNLGSWMSQSTIFVFRLMQSVQYLVEYPTYDYEH